MPETSRRRVGMTSCIVKKKYIHFHNNATLKHLDNPRWSSVNKKPTPKSPTRGALWAHRGVAMIIVSAKPLDMLSWTVSLNITDIMLCFTKYAIRNTQYAIRNTRYIVLAETMTKAETPSPMGVRGLRGVSSVRSQILGVTFSVWRN